MIKRSAPSSGVCPQWEAHISAADVNWALFSVVNSSIWLPLFCSWMLVAKLKRNNYLGSCSVFSTDTLKPVCVLLPGKVSWKTLHAPLEAELCGCLGGLDGWGALVESQRAGGGKNMQWVCCWCKWRDSAFHSVLSVVVLHSLPPHFNRGWWNSNMSFIRITFSIVHEHQRSLHCVSIFYFSCTRSRLTGLTLATKHL